MSHELWNIQPSLFQCPTSYGTESDDTAREIVQTWSEKTPYCGITYPEREISTLTVMNTNPSAVPYTDQEITRWSLLLYMYREIMIEELVVRSAFELPGRDTS